MQKDLEELIEDLNQKMKFWQKKLLNQKKKLKKIPSLSLQNKLSMKKKERSSC